jgi:uncharacterized repeat protein (TIGR04138 family)
MNHGPESLWDAIERIRSHDPRFRPEAYGFIMMALGVAVEGLPETRRDDPDRRHLSGSELLDSIVALARQEFGALAPTVFQEWGLKSGGDVGDLVFQLVETGQLKARPEDRRDDFLSGAPLMRRLAEGHELGVPDVPH